MEKKKIAILLASLLVLSVLFAGISAAYTVTSGTTNTYNPKAPVVHQILNNSLNITWTAPSAGLTGAGTGAIKYFSVFVNASGTPTLSSTGKPTGTTSVYNTSSNTTDYEVISSLTDGVKYYIEVASVNATEIFLNTTVLTAIPGAAPVIKNLVLKSIIGDNYTLSWTTYANGYSTYFQLAYNTSSTLGTSGSAFANISVASTPSGVGPYNYSFTWIAPTGSGTHFYVGIKGINAMGASNVMIVNGTSGTPTIPKVNVITIGIDEVFVNVTTYFSPYYYWIDWGTNSATLTNIAKIKAASAATQTLTLNLPNAQKVYFEVIANNSNGIGGKSENITGNIYSAQPLSFIQGIVENVNGTHLANSDVWVYLYGSVNINNQSALYSTTTNATGYYKVGVLPGYSYYVYGFNVAYLENSIVVNNVGVNGLANYTLTTIVLSPAPKSASWATTTSSGTIILNAANMTLHTNNVVVLNVSGQLVQISAMLNNQNNFTIYSPVNITHPITLHFTHLTIGATYNLIELFPNGTVKKIASFKATSTYYNYTLPELIVDPTFALLEILGTSSGGLVINIGTATYNVSALEIVIIIVVVVLIITLIAYESEKGSKHVRKKAKKHHKKK